MTGWPIVWTLVGLGIAGAAGAVVRDVVTRFGGRHGADGRTAAIAVCNVGGAALLAMVLGAEAAGAATDRWVLIAGTGFCGALTTFSTWVVDAAQRAAGGERRWSTIGAIDLVSQLLVGVGIVTVLARLSGS